MMLCFRSRPWLVLLLLGLLAGLPVLLDGCRSRQSPNTEATGAASLTEPRLDSQYVIQAVRAEAQFRRQEELVRKFYRARQFRLAWFRQHQRRPPADTLLRRLAKAADDGLDPKRYQTTTLSESLAALQAPEADTARRATQLRRADLALTATFFNWASDYYRGVANPRDRNDPNWRVKRNKIKLDHALQTILGERPSTYPYAQFAPLHPQYDYLKKALARLRAQQASGGWPVLPARTRLRPSQADAALVPLLRQRLLGPGAAVPATGPAVYDSTLVAAVQGFQRDLGLRPTGEVSGATLSALNVPLAARERQLILNLERWRWLPKKFEPDYLLVNIPEFRLRVFTEGRPALTMRVIVGKALTATPIFSDKMEYVVLAPYWNVPFSIIDKELRPHLAADPHYLDRLDMEVVRGAGPRATGVDPAAISWATLTPAAFRGYTLRRRPGPRNDLGDVKFIFPNSDDVYLHDTPHDQLFAQSRRDFSHGCVRVEEPLRLAAYLLRDQPAWTPQAIRDTIAQRRERAISLRQKLPVYLVYFTAWADAAGRPHFRDDIYGHDQTLAQAYFK